jgi:hypothetical protein
MIRPLVAALGLLLMTGCWATSIGSPDIGAIPTGPPPEGGPQAQGPITVVGTGRSEGIGWRYSTYEAADGMCVQLEITNLASTSCGDLLPIEGSAFGSVGANDLATTARNVEGIVSSEVAQLYLELTDGQRLPIQLLSLEAAGYDDQAFVYFLPDAARPSQLVAEDAGGEPLGTFEISNLGP